MGSAVVSKATYTKERFIEAFEKAVEFRGEGFRYTDAFGGAFYSEGGCQYTVDGEGACIIGKAIEFMTGLPHTGGNYPASDILREIYGIEDIRVCRAAVEAQRAQDAHRTWGEARDVFRDALDGKVTDFTR